MTEEQAKNRRCWRQLEMHCIGSACMAWRQDRFHDPRERELWSKKYGRQVTMAIGDDADWRLKNPDEPLPPQKGTCGALQAIG